MGRVAPELALDEVRERIVYSYRIFYRVRGDRVTILAVLHGARQITDILNERSSPPSPKNSQEAEEKPPVSSGAPDRASSATGCKDPAARIASMHPTVKPSPRRAG